MPVYKWRKLGHVFAPNGEFFWAMSHASSPFAELVEGDTYRVYFTTRDAANRSFICSGLLDLRERRITQIDSDPVLGPGEAGLFDDSGTAMAYLLNFAGKKHIYYLGWNLKVTVPWLNSIGMATLDDEDGRFKKVSRAPIMDRSEVDPFSISYPSILEEDRRLKMWYGSNLSWGRDQAEMRHVFKTATSEDAINWQRSGHVAVGLQHPNEYALSKPFVRRTSDGYEMWYSFRGNGDTTTYRIGYAVSADGDTWTRLDDRAGIDVSNEGWDSEMICYPFVFDHHGETYMLYNGNGYGKTGFGLATAE